MNTSDGISSEDWDLVHALALDIVNASALGDDFESAEKTTEFLALIERLEGKYGVTASLLATKADYIEDTQERIELLSRGYLVATESGDLKNKTLIASSLAELFWWELGDKKNTRHWLEKLRRSLIDYGDEGEQEVLRSLLRKINESEKN